MPTACVFIRPIPARTALPCGRGRAACDAPPCMRAHARHPSEGRRAAGGAGEREGAPLRGGFRGSGGHLALGRLEYRLLLIRGQCGSETGAMRRAHLSPGCRGRAAPGMPSAPRWHRSRSRSASAASAADMGAPAGLQATMRRHCACDDQGALPGLCCNFVLPSQSGCNDASCTAFSAARPNRRPTLSVATEARHAIGSQIRRRLDLVLHEGCDAPAVA